MVVRFQCRCEQWLEAEETLRGKRKKCPACGANLIVPVLKKRRPNRPGMPRLPGLPRCRKRVQAVEIHIRLASEFPTENDNRALVPLGLPLMQAVEGAKLGEMWAHDYGGRKLVITLLGPSADAMFAAVEHLLYNVPLMKRRGSRVVKLYDYGDQAACKKSTIRYS